MTPEQITLLKTIVANHLAQQSDLTTHYWDKDGGTYSIEIAKMCALDVDTVEKDSQVLAGLGYVELLVRDPSVSYHGIRALQAGIDQVNQIALKDRAAAAAQAEADQATADKAALDQQTLTIINNAVDLGLLAPTAVDQNTLNSLQVAKPAQLLTL